jgi:hypothetical protein
VTVRKLLSLKLLSPDENVALLRDYSPGSFGIEVFANPRQLELRDWFDEHGWHFGESGRIRQWLPTTLIGPVAPIGRAPALPAG